MYSSFPIRLALTSFSLKDANPSKIESRHRKIKLK